MIAGTSRFSFFSRCLVPLLLSAPASAAIGSCIDPRDLDRRELVENIASTMIVIEAVVEEPIDTKAGKGELLRTVRTFVGRPLRSYRIARPLSGGGILWSSNDEFHHERGKRVLEVLRPADAPRLQVPRFFRQSPFFGPIFQTMDRALLQAHVRTHNPDRGYEQIGCERYHLRDDHLLLAQASRKARQLGR